MFIYIYIYMYIHTVFTCFAKSLDISRRTSRLLSGCHLHSMGLLQQMAVTARRPCDSRPDLELSGLEQRNKMLNFTNFGTFF